MGPLGRAFVRLVPFAGLMASTVLSAQGVTTAGIKGVVTGADSAGIPNASVTVTNTATGERWETITRARGRFVSSTLRRRPLLLEARAIGFTPAAGTGITLSLGERRRVDLVLTLRGRQLPRWRSPPAVDPRVNPAPDRAGADDRRLMISRMPLRAGTSPGWSCLSPQAVLTRGTAASIAGQSDRLNGFQIDGASNLDLGGIRGRSAASARRAPSSGVRTLSVEALQELQILIRAVRRALRQLRRRAGERGDPLGLESLGGLGLRLLRGRGA